MLAKGGNTTKSETRRTPRNAPITSLSLHGAEVSDIKKKKIYSWVKK
jgi:hypothetical protein